MSEIHYESPLHGKLRLSEGMAVGIREITDRGMIDLRGSLGDRRFLALVKKVLGFDLPKEPRTSSGENGIAVLWLSIDQWLICGPRNETNDLLTKLNKALANVHSLAVDLSDARAIIRLEGNGAREVIMKGAPVDLTLPEYTPGTVRRLRFGEVAAMVHIINDAPDILDLYVFRSYADFAWDWLVATGKASAGIRLYGVQTCPAS